MPITPQATAQHHCSSSNKQHISNKW